jgi:hypothetical protein
MGFKYTKVTSYKWPVTVELPDNGQYNKETFTAIFKRVGRKAFEDLDDARTAEFIDEVLLGWEDVVDDEGTPIPFCEEMKAELMDDTYFVRGVMEAYLQSLQGAKAKN